MGVEGILQSTFSQNTQENLVENVLITSQAKKIYQLHLSKLQEYNNKLKNNNPDDNVSSNINNSNNSFKNTNDNNINDINNSLRDKNNNAKSSHVLGKRESASNISSSPAKFIKIKEKTVDITGEKEHQTDPSNPLTESEDESDLKITNYGTVGCICLGELNSGGVIVSGTSSGGHSLKHPGRIGQVCVPSLIIFMMNGC